MSDRDIMHLLERADAADRRMQYLQDAIDKRTHWLDAAKERISTLEEQYAMLIGQGELAARFAGQLQDRLLGLSLQIDNLTKRLDALESRTNERT